MSSVIHLLPHPEDNISLDKPTPAVPHTFLLCASVPPYMLLLLSRIPSGLHLPSSLALSFKPQLKCPSTGNLLDSLSSSCSYFVPQSLLSSYKWPVQMAFQPFSLELALFEKGLCVYPGPGRVLALHTLLISDVE